LLRLESALSLFDSCRLGSSLFVSCHTTSESILFAHSSV
jgi:hypothetical protein